MSRNPWVGTGLILLSFYLHELISNMSDNEYFNQGLYNYILYRAEGNGARAPRGTDLSSWMDHQDEGLKAMKQGAATEMTEDRKLVLDHIKFPWKHSNDERWNNNYQELVTFFEANGHCKVPRKTPVLGDWVAHQRREMKKSAEGKKSSLTDERIQKLDLLRFEWNLNDWDANFKLLTSFALTHGHCDVPRSQGSLGNWVYYQRERFGKMTMKEDQVEKLESIGFFEAV